MTKVYHGSKNLFKKFDYGKIGLNGTNEGIGFYFTDNPSIAKNYGVEGYFYVVHFHGKKSLSHEKRTITEEELKKYMIALHQKTDYLSNWGEIKFEGVTNVLNRAIQGEYKYAENDVDLIGSIIHGAGDVKTCLEILYSLLGYDSIVTKAEWGNQTLYIALVNDIVEVIQISKVENNTIRKIA